MKSKANKNKINKLLYGKKKKKERKKTQIASIGNERL